MTFILLITYLISSLFNVSLIIWDTYKFKHYKPSVWEYLFVCIPILNYIYTFVALEEILN